jgi:membrane dipeptidase
MMQINPLCKIFLLSGVLMACLTISLEGQVKTKITEDQIMRIHERALTVDTHCDTPMDMLERGTDIGKRNSTGKVDLPRMKEGGLDAMFFAIFTGQEARNETNYNNVYHLAHNMIDTTLAAVKRNHEMAGIALTAQDAVRLEKEGKRAIYLGMENGFPLAKDLSRIREFYDKGIRYITLCHSYNNDICDSSTDPAGAEHNGLSSFGRQVVLEMNRTGMIIDVSHISDKSLYDVLSLSLAPVIASHSSIRSIAHHKRNLPDELIRALAKKGGVVQVCLLGEYVKDPDTTSVLYRKEIEMRKLHREKWNTMTAEEKDQFRKERTLLRKQQEELLPGVKEYVDHIDHIVRIAGINHVGIGSDFDGGGGLSDCRDVSQFPSITRELLKRGYSEKDIMKIWGGNFFRVFRKVEETARKISGGGFIEP